MDFPPSVAQPSLGKEWLDSGVQVYFGICYHFVPVFLLLTPNCIFSLSSWLPFSSHLLSFLTWVSLSLSCSLSLPFSPSLTLTLTHSHSACLSGSFWFFKVTVSYFKLQKTESERTLYMLDVLGCVCLVEQQAVFSNILDDKQTKNWMNE